MLHVYTPQFTKWYLRWLLENGLLRSQYKEYVDKKIRCRNKPFNANDTFYTRICAEKGEDVAEARLREWNASIRRSDYASLIEPVARGMLMLQSVDRDRGKAEYVKLIDITHETPFPHHNQLNRGNMFVLINRNAPGCGCMMPVDWEIFGPSGRLGIRAVVLSCYSMNNNHNATELGIVLPVRKYDDLDPQLRKSGFTVARIHLDGHTDAETYIPNVSDPDFLMKMLGLMEGPLPRSEVSMGGHFDDAVGFPGATDYLADHLPRLEHYFSELAEKLNHNHKH